MAVAAIGLLIALVFPSLSHVRHAGVQAVSRARLAQHAAAITAYTSDYAGRYPYFTSPTATYSIVWCGGSGYRVLRYFDTAFSWTLVLAEYEQVPCGGTAMFPPTEVVGGPLDWPAWYLYSATLVSDPAFWNRQTRTGPEQWRAVGTHEVTSPSRKGLLVAFHPWDIDQTFGEPRFVAGFADGHVSEHLFSQTPEAYFRGEGEWRGFVFNHGLRVMHTIDGVRGRDY